MPRNLSIIFQTCIFQVIQFLCLCLLTFPLVYFAKKKVSSPFLCQLAAEVFKFIFITLAFIWQLIFHDTNGDIGSHLKLKDDSIIYAKMSIKILFTNIQKLKKTLKKPMCLKIMRKVEEDFNKDRCQLYLKLSILFC